ncbi:transposase (plasmid) [Serratia nevei]|uniref:transposase n=1 Tax=Serratia nevei TaxID=2703794 RepID=UPI003F6BCD6A
MTQRKQTKRHFSPEFKLEAIEQVTKYQQRAVDVTLALDLDPSQLRKWIRQYEAELQGDACRRGSDTRPASYPEAGETGSLSGQGERDFKAGNRVDAERLELRAQIRALHQRSRGSAGSRTLSLLMCRRVTPLGAGWPEN